ncbi:hypothetical protein E2C01_068063 [Portunus trituberculatus]|uniref:Uncharacterized protein n=1 Tax=Portunus trituberculatus TaxID=210409 RepID=A0A5B7HVJ0_PORTR|nr:hypothetical protein [Portunus trituberculatus]
MTLAALWLNTATGTAGSGKLR